MRGSCRLRALGVRAKDDRTLEVDLERPTGYFLSLTAFATYLPLREDFYRARPGRYAAEARDILTNGPFVLTRWVHAASLTFEKNPHYWDAAGISIERIEVPYFTQDPNTRYNLFKDGKIDVTGLDRDLLGRAQADAFRMRSFATGSIFYSEFNHRAGRPTRNYHLRKALQLVFDPSTYVSKVIGIPGTRPGVSLIPSWVPGAEKPFRKEYPVAAGSSRPRRGAPSPRNSAPGAWRYDSAPGVAYGRRSGHQPGGRVLPVPAFEPARDSPQDRQADLQAAARQDAPGRLRHRGCRLGPGLP